MPKKRGRPKKIAGEPPQGTGYDDEEMKAHLEDAFDVSKPEKTERDIEKENVIEMSPEDKEAVATLTESGEQIPGKPKPSKEEERSKEGEPKEMETPTESPEKKEESDALREEEGERKEEVETPPAAASERAPKTEPEGTIPAGVIKDMRKLRERIAELEAQQAAPQPQPSFPAYPDPIPKQPQAGIPKIPVEYDADGQMVLPDPSNPEVREYFRRLQQPSPEEQMREAQQQAESQRMAAQQELEREIADFVRDDERRQPFVERIREGIRLLDLRARELQNRTGEVARTPETMAQFLEKFGAAQEFRQYVPEISSQELPYFIDQVVVGSNLARRRYMTDLCDRVLGPKPKGGNGSGNGAGAKKVPDEIPPRLAAQGAVNPDRTGRPGKEERVEELARQKTQDPWSFTKQQDEELMQLRKELGIVF